MGPGWGATDEETARAAGRRGPGWGRPFGATSWAASALGFGAYRVDDRASEHARALHEALDGGVTLVDTASNYGLGASERLVGRVLAERESAREGARREVVVVTKAGYLQGPLLAEARETHGPGPEPVDAQGELSGVAAMGPDHWHTLDPRWLRRSLKVSTERLGGPPDVMLLHNPEYMLRVRAPGEPDAAVRARFRRGLRRAFQALQACCDEGRLSGFGVSSNGLAEPGGHPEHTRVEEFVEAAAGAPGFAVVQLPLNLIEDGAFTMGEVAAASEAGLAVLANRPLNAWDGERLLRLAADPAPEEASRFKARRRELHDLEQRLAAEVPSARTWRWAVDIPRALATTPSAAAWDATVRGHAEEALRRVHGPVLAERAGQGRVVALVEAHREAVRALWRCGRAALARREREWLAPALRRLAAEIPPRPEEGLASQAARWVATRPGVSSALVGMRRPAYVRDLIATW